MTIHGAGMGRIGGCVLLLVWGLAAPLASAQETPMVSLPITVRTDAGSAQDVRVGIDPAATEGIDPALGEEEQPPLPPSSAFDVRLIDDDISASGLGSGLRADLRPGPYGFVGTRTHELRIQPGDDAGAVTVAWTLPGGITGTLSDVATGGEAVQAAMQGDGSLTLDDPGLTTLTITLSYAGPYVALTDGRDGERYDPPAPTPGTDRNPVGRLRLAASEEGAELASMVASNDGDPVDGIASAELWRSADAAFDPATDAEVAATTTATPASFDDVSVPISADTTYLFLVLDLTEEAAGDYDPELVDETALSVSGGLLASVNGTTRGTFEHGSLSSSATPLPVELVRFEAAVDDETVRLTWTTASETGNAGFQIERRGEGAKGREGAWTTVGSVEGAGTTSKAQNYRFADGDLPYEADRLTYRLQQVDTDGSTHVSETIIVERDVEAVQLLAPFPNPARQQVRVRVSLPKKQETTIHLYDVLGRQVRTVVRGAKTGRHERTLDVRDLSSGIYVLRLRVGGTIRTQKLTVVR